MSLQRGVGFSVFVRREIVADHDGPRFDLGHQDVADVGSERGSVHSAFDDPRRYELIMGEASNEGLGAPSPEGSGGVEPGSAF